MSDSPAELIGVLVVARFRTSARSVDMLGRQQIAGIPTAVSEIYKNAYDAYARSVRGDFFPEQRVLMIRDNGIGMSLEDLQNRWLTVGTESKTSGSRLPPLMAPEGLKIRRQMGEKGIGRLAIASIGPQLLIVSRARDPKSGELGDLVVCLIQWTLFEIPGLVLDDIPIPLVTVNEFDEITPGLIGAMKDEIVEGVTRLGDAVPDEYKDRLSSELDHLNFDPRRFFGLNGPDVRRETGTAFLVTPIYEDVDAVIEDKSPDGGEFAVSEFQRFLLGFTNDISAEDGPGQDFQTQFFAHSENGFRDLIDPDTYFWGADDFDFVDHVIEGSFDEYGKFIGTVKVYDKPAMDVAEPWKAGRGNRSACGPFHIRFGYVQGQASESKLAMDDFARMTARLNKIGGLYVYRDGIRVLPYGNSDFDYLEIEKRRSLKASSYYFSYRRMFGAISLDSSENVLLQEKAGREGFRENRAYREFRGILQEFLVQIAANFFSGDADSSREWRDERARLRGASAQSAARAKAEHRTREKFLGRLSEATFLITSGLVVREVAKLVDDFKAGESPDRDSLVTEGFSKLRNSFEVERPEGLALTRDQERSWKSYVGLRTTALDTIREGVERIDAERGAPDAEQTQLRVERVQGSVLRRVSEILVASGQAREEVKSSYETVISEVQKEIEELGAKASQLIDGLEQATVVDEIRVNEELGDLELRARRRLTELTTRSRDFSSNGDLMSENVRLREEILDLNEQIEGNLELLQLGQAVQIVSHEFEASIRSVRSNLQDLLPWARSTPRLQPIVRDLRASFGHLDSYLKLFTPLQRRLYRENTTFTGREILNFLEGVFADRMIRHGVAMTATPNFQTAKIHGYPSTFYPVFVNLVDNAVHWMSAEPAEKSRLITLDANDGQIFVQDTGPGVRDGDRDVIFERGFGRRRGGRGLGLSIARELLERDSWSLTLGASSQGARFVLEEVRGAGE